MPVSKERFLEGLSYEAYKEQMTRNRDRLESNEQTIELDGDDLAFFAQLPAPLHVLAIAEDWCGDVIANLPVLAALANQSGKLDVRVFLRDQNLDIMNQYLKEGQHQSIPVFVFFDQDWQELGHWIERPAQVSVLQGQMIQELQANDPAFRDVAPGTAMGQLPEEARNRLMQAFGDFRQQHRSFSDREVVRELQALVEHGTPQAAEPERPAPAAVQVQRQAKAGEGKQPVKVSITYCAACGYEPQTLALAQALMQAFVYDLGSIELIPWHDGTFDVVVGGDLVHSMVRDGGFPEHQTIIAAVRERLGS